jgi:hypothetical protein
VLQVAISSPLRNVHPLRYLSIRQSLSNKFGDLMLATRESRMRALAGAEANRMNVLDRK